jgi:hypothetical protein
MQGFQSLIACTGEDQHRFVDLVPGAVCKDYSRALWRERDVCIEAILACGWCGYVENVLCSGFQHHRHGSHGVSKENAERRLALICGEGECGGDVEQACLLRWRER